MVELLEFPILLGDSSGIQVPKKKYPYHSFWAKHKNHAKNQCHDVTERLVKFWRC